MQKTGIFAGSFDPVHLGHTAFVSSAIDEHGLDKVLVLVEKKPRYKSCLADYKHRKKMVQLTFANNSQIVMYEVNTIDFPITNGLPEIRNEHPDAQLYLLLGKDVAEHIDSWENVSEVLKDVQLIVGKRDDHAPYGMASSFKIRTILKNQKISADLDPQVQQYINKHNLYRD